MFSTKPSVVVDIGGSSVRVAQVCDGSVADVRRVDVSAYADLLAGIRSTYAAPRSVAVSLAGFVDSSAGDVRLCRHALWAEGHFAKRLRNDLGCPVIVMNDGEAHALAMLCTPGVTFGAVSVSLGTSVGIGVIGADRTLVLPCSAENWDLGDWQLRTRASDHSLWWALGCNGLHELENNMGAETGARHFGYRLGAFLVQLTSILQPRTIVVSGGIANRHWDLMQDNAISELSEVPKHFVRPTFMASPFMEAGLVGAAHAMANATKRGGHAG